MRTEIDVQCCDGKKINHNYEKCFNTYDTAKLKTNE